MRYLQRQSSCDGIDLRAVAQTTSNQTYEQMRPYLFAVAYRMTGSASDAEDLVQDAWIRYLDAGSPEVESLRAWLTTVVSRLALDYLKSARVQREQYVGPWMPEPVLTSAAIAGPEETVEQREAVSLAFLMLLERLNPEQRIVYVLREGFGLPFEDIGGHVGKSAAACRQVYRRAQLWLTDERHATVAPRADHRRLAERFVAAVSTGDAAQVADVLASDVVWVSDGGPDRLAARRPVVGVDRVSRAWAAIGSKLGQELQLTYAFADLNGAPAVVVRDRGEVDRVFAFDIRDSRISTVRAILNLDKLGYLDRVLGVPNV